MLLHAAGKKIIHKISALKCPAALSRLIICTMILHTANVSADEVRVAVAANFFASAKALAPAFKKETSHGLRLSSASTGKLAIQIMHGAPFDIFLAADAKRPARLIKQGLAIAPAYTYAIGQLALFSKHLRVDQTVTASLLDGTIKRVAIANPEAAPYGLAAQQFLNTLSLPSQLITVKGDNVSQALQFADTRNVDAAFVSLGQAQSTKGFYTIINSNSITPIAQKAVLLTPAKNNEAAKAFLAFLQSPTAKTIIHNNGYLTE